MTPEERERIIGEYDDRLQKYGYSQHSLGHNKPKQRLRYDVLLQYWRLQNAVETSVLDFGCGFGDLYGYASSEKLAIKYHGVDFNASFIDIARNVYPEAEFSIEDPSTVGLARTYDVIVACMTHNHEVENHETDIENLFSLFAAHATRGFAMNFLSDRVNFRRPGSAYTNPEMAFGLASRHSRRVILRHDYMPFEFTIIVDLRDEYADDLTVFSGFEHLTGS